MPRHPRHLDVRDDDGRAGPDRRRRGAVPPRRPRRPRRPSRPGSGHARRRPRITGSSSTTRTTSPVPAPCPPVQARLPRGGRRAAAHRRSRPPCPRGRQSVEPGERCMLAPRGVRRQWGECPIDRGAVGRPAVSRRARVRARRLELPLELAEPASSRSGSTVPSRSLDGSGDSSGRDAPRRCASRRPPRRRRRPPSRRRRGGSPPAPGRRAADRAAAKIAGWGLIVPTRWLTTIARRCGEPAVRLGVPIDRRGERPVRQDREVAVAARGGRASADAGRRRQPVDERPAVLLDAPLDLVRVDQARGADPGPSARPRPAARHPAQPGEDPNEPLARDRPRGTAGPPRGTGARAPRPRPPGTRSIEVRPAVADRHPP